MEFSWNLFEEYNQLAVYGSVEKCAIVCYTQEQLIELIKELNKRNIQMANGKLFDLERVESTGKMIKRILNLETIYPIMIFNEGTVGVLRKDDNSYSDSVLFEYGDVFNQYSVTLV